MFVSVQKAAAKRTMYKDAEIVYSIHLKKLLEMANEAGAIYRIDCAD